MKNLALLVFSAAVAAVFFVFHRLVSPTAWLGVGLAVGSLWYILDPLVLFPRYTKFSELPFPLSRSFWLLLIFWPLALFILTSTGSSLAQGMMVALGLGIGIELVSDISQPDVIKTAFHFPSASKWNATELQILSGGWLVGLIILITLFVI